MSNFSKSKGTLALKIYTFGIRMKLIQRTYQ